MKRTLYVCHGMYGCETGCCGYRLCVDDEGDETVVIDGHGSAHFEFSHAYNDETAREFALANWPDYINDDTDVEWGKWASC